MSVFGSILDHAFEGFWHHFCCLFGHFLINYGETMSNRRICDFRWMLRAVCMFLRGQRSQNRLKSESKTHLKVCLFSGFFTFFDIFCEKQGKTRFLRGMRFWSQNGQIALFCLQNAIKRKVWSLWTFLAAENFFIRCL